jgi:hypothetical protein
MRLSDPTILRVGETFLGICTPNPHNGGTP